MCVCVHVCVCQNVSIIHCEGALYFAKRLVFCQKSPHSQRVGAFAYTYRLAKIHRIPHFVGLFPQKSHYLQGSFKGAIVCDSFVEKDLELQSPITVSTDLVAPPEFTKSRNSSFSVQI